MTHLFRIVDCSRNNIPGSADAVAEDVEAILKVSRRNNARDGISGGLLLPATASPRYSKGRPTLSKRRLSASGAMSGIAMCRCFSRDL